MRDPNGDSGTAANVADDAVPGSAWTARDLLVLAAITAVAAALRLWGIEQWSWSDAEATTWRALTQPFADGAGGFTSSGESLHPLVYGLVRWLLSVGVLPGYGEGWVRLPFAFAGTLAVPLVAVFARRLAGRAVAVAAALVVAIHPAHVAASQTADPVVFAATVALFAGALATLRARWPWLAATAVAGLCAPSGWLAAPLLAWIGRGAGVRPSRRVALAVAVALAVLALPVVGGLVAQARLPLLLLAGLGTVIAPELGGRVLAAAAVPLAVGGALRLGGGGDAGDAGVWFVVSLPAWSLLAALGVVYGGRLFASAIARPRWFARGGALFPGSLLAVELAIALFLHVTVFRGGRAPWRDAQRAALATVEVSTGLAVVAGVGCDVLRCYLRPNHWRQPGIDPHPGIAVEPLADGDGRPAQLAALAAERGVLILRDDEHTALTRDAAAQAALAAFELIRLLPCPQEDGDWSIYVLRGAAKH